MSALPNHTIIHNNPVPDGAFCIHHYTPYWVYKEQGRTDEVASHDQDVMNMKAIKNGTPIQDASVLRVSAAMRQLLRPPFTVVVVPPSNASATESGLHKVARALADMEGVENGAIAQGSKGAPKTEANGSPAPRSWLLPSQSLEIRVMRALANVPISNHLPATSGHFSRRIQCFC
jgi:hypothetical protein